MSLILAGIDEAGYGPTLGPLSVGLAVLRVNDWDGEGTPNLWKLLASGVCREPGRSGKTDKNGRIAIADSKHLKLPNSVTTSHPLIHLERGVLTFLRAMTGTHPPATDTDLYTLLEATLPDHPCYGVDPTALPVSTTDADLAIASNMVHKALAASKIDVLALRCHLLGESDFNSVIRATNNKGETVVSAIGRHLRMLWDDFGDQRLGIVCDRLGGRASYAPLLARELPGTTVQIVEETDTRSRYTIHDATRRAGIAFMTEGESAHLPVALASMIAKFTRELAMMRFNRHWSWMYAEAKGGSLRPTAGYSQDARRWLDDVGDVLTKDDRQCLVRIA